MSTLSGPNILVCEWGLGKKTCRAKYYIL